MGMWDTLFGETKKQSVLTTGQQDLLDRLSGLVLDDLGESGEVYGGPLVPGRNALMQDAYGRALGGGMGVAMCVERD